MKFFASVTCILLSFFIQNLHAYVFSGHTLLSAAKRPRIKQRQFNLQGGRSFRHDSSENEADQPSVRAPVRRPRERSTRNANIFRGKVSRIYTDELTEIITTSKIKAHRKPDERLMRGVTIPHIDFSSDLSVATVYLAIAGNSVEKRQVFVWLSNHNGQVRHSLSQRLKNFRRLPILRFSLVDTQTDDYLEETFEEIAKEYRIPAPDDADVEFEDDEEEVEDIDED